MTDLQLMVTVLGTASLIAGALIAMLPGPRRD